ncbi:MAG TPA: starch-binding protein [Lachnospiraceae bacterium]|nr:starch-binding protein [Lachnospiraceae bacterium]
MKKKLEKVLSLVLVFAFAIIGCTLSGKIAKAADTTTEGAGNVVKVYYYNENGWDGVNVWAWTIETTIDLAKNAWPGDAMTDEGNGWFSAEVTADENIGVLFTNNAGDQTSDCKDLEPGKTYWITNGSEDLLNDSGMGGGVSLVAATEPKAGWPEGPAADVATSATASEDKDSNNVVLYVVIGVAVVVVVGAITGVVLTKKKKGNTR